MTFQTYNSNIPNPPNRPSSDVPLMQTNTNSISALILQDHFGFNDNAGGNHKQVHLKNTASPGGIGANADAVFFANSSSGQSFPFWQNGATTYRFFGPQSIVANGYSTIIAGVILQWGKVNSPGSGPSSVSFPLAFPNAVFTVQLTPRNDGSHSSFSYYLDGAPSQSSFTYRGTTSSSNTLFWFAVGN